MIFNACFWQTFFALLGTQNCHFGLPEPNFSKPHFWKTRIGFRSAWTLTNILHGDCPETKSRPVSIFCSGGMVRVVENAKPEKIEANEK